MNARVKRTGRIAGGVLAALLALFAFVCLIVGISVKRNGSATLFGYQLRYVLTGSMEPAIRAGSVVFIKTGAGEDFYASLTAGKIVTFLWFDAAAMETRVVTHRVESAEKTADGYRYRLHGDAAPDEYQTVRSAEGTIIGEAVGSSYALGACIGFFRKPAALIGCVIVPCLVVAVWEIARVAVILRDGKRNRAAADKDAEIEALKKKLERYEGGGPRGGGGV